MHPAKSIILFSVLSGIGFGYLFFLGLMPSTSWQAFISFFIAFAFAIGGLFASFFHLANKKNAYKSFREWRTSWLSREAWAALLGLTFMGVYAFFLVFFNTDIRIIGVMGSLMTIFTVLCTSMIYAQIRAVPRWNQPLTPIIFIAYAITAGAWLQGLASVKYLLIITLVLQILYWIRGDQIGMRLSSKNTAIGISGDIKPMFEAHSTPNYLMREMVFVIGRKHAKKIRILATIFGFLIPILITFTLASYPFFIVLGFISHVIGAFASRWLFFAEAQHTVSLYY